MKINKKWIVLVVVIVVIIIIARGCREKTYKEIYESTEYSGNGTYNTDNYSSESNDEIYYPSFDYEESLREDSEVREAIGIEPNETNESQEEESDSEVW